MNENEIYALGRQRMLERLAARRMGITGQVLASADPGGTALPWSQVLKSMGAKNKAPEGDRAHTPGHTAAGNGGNGQARPWRLVLEQMGLRRVV